MDSHHLHLLLNHIPIIGLAFSLLLVGVGLVVRSRAIILAGLVLTMITGLAAIPANATGDQAEDIVESLPLVSEIALEAHEEVAETFLILAIVTAIVAALTVLGNVVLLPRWRWWWAMPTLVIGGVAMLLAWQTGATGGQIRRPEFRTDAASTSGQPSTTPTQTDDD